MTFRLTIIAAAIVLGVSASFAAKPARTATSQPAATAAKAPVDSTRVLFIGNSFTYFNDLPGTLQRLAAGASKRDRRYLAVRSFTPGGCTLKRHSENPEVLAAIAGGGWDYVVLQEQSTAPALPTRTVAQNTYPYAALLDSLVMAANPGAQVIFYMTWGHKDGCTQEHGDYPLIDTYEGMQARLATSYLEMAHDNDARCAPVGLAWQRVRAERPYDTLYRNDRYHPSAMGTYLAACVIYATMLASPYQSSYTADLPPATAEYLQSVAQQTVLQNLPLLNIH